LFAAAAPYTARITVPKALVALMSAISGMPTSLNSEHRHFSNLNFNPMLWHSWRQRAGRQEDVLL
jgi:hypothetical protein